MPAHRYFSHLAASIFLAAGLAHTAAQAQNVAQGFEGSAADTWSFTPTPGPYNDLAATDQWGVLTTIGTAGTGVTVTTPSAGANLWGGRDLEGPLTNNASIWHYLDFAPVAIVAGATGANTVTFKYNSTGFDTPDSLAYVVQFNNGSTWPIPRTYTQLNKNTAAWVTVTMPVPAGSTHARLRLAVRQNGNDDWVAFDEISLGQSPVAPAPTPDLSFTGAATPLIVTESAGTVALPLSIRNANATASTVQAVVAPLGTATAGADYTFASTQTITFAPGSTTATLTLPLTDDATAEATEYFSVRLQNPTNATLTAGATEFLVYINDNDTPAPARTNNLRLNWLGSYPNGTAFNGSTQINSAEIVAHDPSTQRLYVANSVGGKLDILNFATPGMLTPVASINILTYGNINSVAVRNGLVACAIENTAAQQNGSIVFFDSNGTFIKQVAVGAMPDMITFSPDGRYLITANEGDSREYAGLNEINRLGDAAYVLDPTIFPQAALLKNNSALGRLNLTNKLGDTDGDGDFDQIFAFGGRSFSILNANTGALVHDSGDLLERVTSTDAAFGSIFNASNTTGAPARKNRSDDKGPEPEGVTIGVMRDTTYAFVSMERVGGVAVLNVNDPANPRLVQYINNRGLTAGTGDLGPEGIVFVSAANSPTGAPLLLLANEISSTVAVYQIGLLGVVSSAKNGVSAPEALYCYPNPATPDAAVRLSRPVAGAPFDGMGRTVRQLPTATDRLDVRGLAAGLYVLHATDGATSRVVVR